jgi:hypothetical protein
MTLTFLTERSESILSRAKFPQDNYNVPNDHPCFDKAQRDLWASLAESFGIDIQETGYTIRAAQKPDGTILYTPYVGSNSKEACIFWGKVVKPLSSLNRELVEIAIGGTKRPALECFVTTLEDVLTLTLMIAKGDRDDATTEHKELANAVEEDKRTILRKALRVGKLHLYLSQSFQRAEKLSTVAGRTLTVIGYTLDPKYGRYSLETLEAGMIAGNTQIARKLSRSPIITPESPATLEVGLCSGKTSTGYDIYPAYLTTAADRELPVFDFGSSTEENVTEEFVFS